MLHLAYNYKSSQPSIEYISRLERDAHFADVGGIRYWTYVLKPLVRLVSFAWLSAVDMIARL